MIKCKEEMEELLNNCDGCVIYGAGLVGSCLVQYLIREKLSSKIICVAVKSREGNPDAVMGIPVCELKEMEEYREKYLFLIATLEHIQSGILKELKEFGCKNVTAVSNTYYADIRGKVNDFTPDIMCKLQRGFAGVYDNFQYICDNFKTLYDRLDRMWEELTYLIEEQNEIRDMNIEAFSEYRNCFRGKDVVVLATGPTLNQYEPIEGAIHIGVNTVYKDPRIPLDYLFVQDARSEFLEQGKFSGIENVQCKIFMGRLSKRSPYEYTEFPEEYRIGGNIKNYMIDYAFPRAGIYRDICRHGVHGGFSVTFSALHFALFTYPQRIYLVGCDNAPTGHYDGTGYEKTWEESSLPEFKKIYESMKKFACIHYPETEIISVNPVGLKGIFKDIYTRQKMEG